MKDIKPTNNMKKLILTIVLGLITFALASAETIYLRTGGKVEGTILFQNEEVVIIRNAEGQRFQYPRADVELIGTKEEEEVKEVKSEGIKELKSEGIKELKSESVDEPMPEPEIQVSKKASILLELAGGPAINAKEKGGGFSIDLLVGSHRIGDRHIFIGGGVGYHGVFVGGKYNFLPIQAAFRIPFMEAKHSPVFGLSIGYGIALSKTYKGGIYASLDMGYRYQINPRTALAVLVYSHFQRASIEVGEQIEGDATTFMRQKGCNLINPGLKLAFYF
jgi:hypothetical protein